MAPPNQATFDIGPDPSGFLFRFKRYQYWPLSAPEAHLHTEEIEKQVSHPLICLRQTTKDGVQGYEVVITTKPANLGWTEFIPLGQDRKAKGKWIKEVMLVQKVHGLGNMPRSSVVLDIREWFEAECFCPFFDKKVGDGKEWQYRLTIKGLHKCRCDVGSRKEKLRILAAVAG